MVTQIDNHVLLPHLPNWRSPVSIQRQWQTAVERSLVGSEERLGMRPRPRLQLTFTLLPFSITEQARLLARLRAALKSGYACAPHWGRGIAVVSASGTSIVLDGNAWRYVGEDDWILIRLRDFSTPDEFETAQLSDVNGSTLSLSAELTGTYGPGAVVWPLVFGHLTCSELDHGSNWHAGVQITLREFRPKQPPPTWENICFIDPWGGCESWNNFTDTVWTPDPDPDGHFLGGLVYTCLGDWLAFCNIYGITETWDGISDFTYAGAGTQKIAAGESWNLPSSWPGNWIMVSVACLGAYDTFTSLADGSLPDSWTGELNLVSGDEEDFDPFPWVAEWRGIGYYHCLLYGGSTNLNNYTGKQGFAFTTDASAPVTIGQVRRWKITGSGTHTIELIRASDKATLASVVINLSGWSNDSWVTGFFSSVITLATNTRYYLVCSETNGGDNWRDASGTSCAKQYVNTVNPVRSSDGVTFTDSGTANTGYSALGFFSQ